MKFRISKEIFNVRLDICIRSVSFSKLRKSFWFTLNRILKIKKIYILFKNYLTLIYSIKRFQQFLNVFNTVEKIMNKF